MISKEDQSFLGQKRTAEVSIHSIEAIDNDLNVKEDSITRIAKKCFKCFNETGVITITSIEEALNFLKENDKIKDDNKKIEQSLIPYKLLQNVDVCKKCLLDKCTPPNEIKHYFKMLQIVKVDKNNQSMIKDSKVQNNNNSNVIQVSLKLNSNMNNKQSNENKSITSSSPNQVLIQETSSLNEEGKEKETNKDTKTVQPIFTTIMQLQNQSTSNSNNNSNTHIPIIPDTSNPNIRMMPINLQPNLHQQHPQPNSFKNPDMNTNTLFSNSMPQLNPMKMPIPPYSDYHSAYQPSYDKKKPSQDTETQERNLELINQALDELKAQIGTMRYCNQLQKNSLSSLFNYMEFFNEQFKSHSYYQNIPNNNQFPMQSSLLYNNNPQSNINMMNYYPKQIPLNMPLSLNPDQMPSLFHSKIPNPSFQNQNQRGGSSGGGQ